MIRSIWYQPASEGVQECVGLEVGVPKRFLRIWPGSGETDHNWVMHKTAWQVWASSTEIERMVSRITQLDTDSAIPYHEQIAGHFRDRIESGELLPEDKLPTNDEMARHYGVSKRTVDRAMKILQAEGLIVVRVRGYTRAGKFVTHANRNPNRG